MLVEGGLDEASVEADTELEVSGGQAVLDAGEKAGDGAGGSDAHGVCREPRKSTLHDIAMQCVAGVA